MTTSLKCLVRAMKGFKDLDVYRLAYKLAMDVFVMSNEFPKEERYALTVQIRRASRSVCSNIAEGYRKRIYPNHFGSKISDTDGEASETLVWLDFARDCSYLTREEYQHLYSAYRQVGRMLGGMIKSADKFKPKSNDE